MRMSVSEAKGQLLELVRRAEAGEEVVLTRHGRPVARVTGLAARVAPERRRQILEAVRASGRSALPGPSAARSQDFLYDDAGLPR